MASKNERPPNKIAVLTVDGDERSVGDLLRALNVQFGDFPNEGAGTYLVHCDKSTGFPLSAKRLVIQRRTTASEPSGATTAYKWLWAELATLLPSELVAYLQSEYRARKTLEIARWREGKRNDR